MYIYTLELPCIHSIYCRQAHSITLLDLRSRLLDVADLLGVAGAPEEGVLVQEGKTSFYMYVYLCGRKQRVLIDGQVSGWIDSKSGVLQGSLLRPVVFLININDIEYGLCCNISEVST